MSSFIRQSNNKLLKSRSVGYWNEKQNVQQFLNKLTQIYNLKTIEDWNTLTKKKILLHGGRSLFRQYSLFDLKCLACPEGKLIFDKPKQSKGYWDNIDNVNQFLNEIKEKYNVNSSKDWDKITQKQIQLNGGGSLLCKYSMYDLKCMGTKIENKNILIKPKKNKRILE